MTSIEKSTNDLIASSSSQHYALYIAIYLTSSYVVVYETLSHHNETTHIKIEQMKKKIENKGQRT